MIDVRKSCLFSLRPFLAAKAFAEGLMLEMSPFGSVTVANSLDWLSVHIKFHSLLNHHQCSITLYQKLSVLAYFPLYFWVGRFLFLLLWLCVIPFCCWEAWCFSPDLMLMFQAFLSVHATILIWGWERHWQLILFFLWLINTAIKLARWVPGI